MAGALTRRKPIDDSLAGTEEEGFKLDRKLSARDLVVIGVGLMVGAGIFVLTGEGATTAGPGVTTSFLITGLAAALAALCYAEFAAMVPVAGSAYTFSYAALGELLAFIIGWDLVLELTIGSAAVAVGFGGYLNALLDQIFGVALPAAITSPPGDGGSVNLFAILLVVGLVALLVRGIKVSARATLVMVILTVAVLALVIVVGATEVDTDNWTPFFPAGFEGVQTAAALVFFAYVGFDVVATTAEESRNPQRDMPIGILGSLAIVTFLYIAVSLVVTGMVPSEKLTGDAPVATAFDGKGLGVVVALIYLGALVATGKTTLNLMLGQTRVAFAMARDRLLPSTLGRTHPRFHTPHRLTYVVGAVVALLAGLVPLTTLVELVNIGTLLAFVLVSVGLLYLRRAEPERHRPFRVPFGPLIPVLSIVASVYLAAQLESGTWVRFLLWMAIGLVVYVVYSRRSSLLAP